MTPCLLQTPVCKSPTLLEFKSHIKLGGKLYILKEEVVRKGKDEQSLYNKTQEPGLEIFGNVRTGIRSWGCDVWGEVGILLSVTNLFSKFTRRSLCRRNPLRIYTSPKSYPQKPRVLGEVYKIPMSYVTPDSSPSSSLR